MTGALVKQTSARRVVPEQQGQVPTRQSSRSSRRSSPTPLLDLRDVAGDAREQLAAGPPREERRRLAEDVPEEPIAHVADHQLADVGHPVGRQIGADALDQVGDDDRHRDLEDALLTEQDLIEDWLDEVGDGSGGGAVDDHRGKRRGSRPDRAGCVPQQPPELVTRPRLPVVPRRASRVTRALPGCHAVSTMVPVSRYGGPSRVRAGCDPRRRRARPDHPGAAAPSCAAPAAPATASTPRSTSRTENGRPMPRS